jgi:hypothetical protein
MKRRTLLRSFAAVVVARPLSDLSLLTQSTRFSDTLITTLKAIAEVVLPSSIGPGGRDVAVGRFIGWFANYREGAERGGGYGNAQLSAPTGPSPIARYPAQFAALDQAAQAQGGGTFAALGVEHRRLVIEAALNGSPPVTRMPARPTGANLIADFMGYYYNSADAHDLCYNAAIGRDTCRGLEGSEQAPPPLGKG